MATDPWDTPVELNLGAEQINTSQDRLGGDWPKLRSWDLPKDLDGFLRYLGGGDEKASDAVLKRELAVFLTYPAAVPMPDDIWAGLQARGLVPAGVRRPTVADFTG
jgi:hypothetical protein